MNPTSRGNSFGNFDRKRRCRMTPYTSSSVSGSSFMFERASSLRYSLSLRERDGYDMGRKRVHLIALMLSVCSFCCHIPAALSLHPVLAPSVRSWSGTQQRSTRPSIHNPQKPGTSSRSLSMIKGIGGGPGIIIIVNDDGLTPEEDDEEDDPDEEQEEDPYLKAAASEFEDTSARGPKDSQINNSKSSLALPKQPGTITTTKPNMDWGGALGTLRKRVSDVEQGLSQKPSQALYRLLSESTPNQLIGSFVQSANPQVVQAMSGAIESLLGGLSSNPMMTGFETIVKATGDKIGSLCFQLQMTGYMFRNAEYVIALRKIMQLQGTATLQDYKDAFDRIDVDGSGYIDSREVKTLLQTVYKDGMGVPAFEIDAFMKFFDSNADGKISWEEFERGLGVVFLKREEERSRLSRLSPGSGAVTAIGAAGKAQNVKGSITYDDEDDDEDDDDEEEDDTAFGVEPEVIGTVEIELEDGKIVEVDAKEYVENLKAEARMLKEVLMKSQQQSSPQSDLSQILFQNGNNPVDSSASSVELSSITSYIASRQGDVKSLTAGISPEIVETMKLLVDFVLEGGERISTTTASPNSKKVSKEEMELEIPGSALQQLALWQLVLGYKLREYEATGEYLKLLE